VKYSATKNVIFQADENTKLPSYVWIPDGKVKAIVIAIHGGMAHGGDWENTALFLKEKGIATYALDLRWHGLFPECNPGEKNIFHIDTYDTYAKDIHKYYKSIRKENPNTPVFILSHSNGGLISLYYGLTLGKDSEIKGLIVSSPWLVNRVKVPAPLMLAAKIIAFFKPTFSITPEPLTDVLTHDPEITARHYKDEESGVRGTTVSAKLSVEYLKAQKFVLKNISTWNQMPVLGIIAGDDHLADAQSSIDALKSITAVAEKTLIYPKNYHENFNELNREDIFEEIWNWIKGIN
jgi:alpha-beta hydrolase superfamily lysophospholipase